MDGGHEGGVVTVGMTRVLGRAVAAGFVGLAGCTTILGIPDPDELEPDLGIGGAASSASASASGMADAGGMGGADGSSCMVDTDCPPPENECITVSCSSTKTCSYANVPQGTPTLTQVDGDCMVYQCSGNGAIDNVENFADPANDMKECTTDKCQLGGATTHAVMLDKACSQNGGKVCALGGDCVECSNTIDCAAGKTCSANDCIDQSCFNGLKDGSESDINCGGPNCYPCGTNKSCVISSDCASLVCKAGKCQAATCSDQIKNGKEADIDCGAWCPVACGLGKSCISASDCISGICMNGACFEVNGCNAVNTEDLTAVATATVSFAGLKYSPPCIRVKAGTKVTFLGSFSSHPLVGGEVKNNMAVPAASGPFIPLTNKGNMRTFLMFAPGMFPFFCDFHSSEGMYGTVFVVP